MAKVIGFSNQKGGVGKSFLTMYVATLLQHTGKRVRVFDADYPQHTIEKIRLKEKSDLEKDAELQEKFSEFENKPFDLIRCKIDTLVESIGIFKLQTDMDYIFVDVPGTLNQANILTLMQSYDSIIIPTEPKMEVYSSTIEALQIYKQLKLEAKIGVVWNRINLAESPNLRDAIEVDIDRRGGATVFKNFFNYTVALTRNVSTYYPTENKAFAGLVEEMFKFGFL